MLLIPPAPLLVVVHTDAAIISASLVPDGQTRGNGNFMKKKSRRSEERSMKSNYDFSQAIRGKYARRYAQGANVVILEPDVAKVFPTSKAVNTSLRKIIRQQALEPSDKISNVSLPSCCHRTPPIISGLTSDSQLIFPMTENY